MYHIVYLTTNQVNGKIYVGVHSTQKLDDTYKGSGQALKLAFKKYGKQNFKRDILFYCLESKDAYAIEEQIVDLDFISRSNTYNLSIGGYRSSGVKRLGTNLTSAHKKAIGDAHRGKSYEEKHGIEKALQLKEYHKNKFKELYTQGILTKRNLNEGLTKDQISERNLKSATKQHYKNWILVDPQGNKYEYFLPIKRDHGLLILEVKHNISYKLLLKNLSMVVTKENVDYQVRYSQRVKDKSIYHNTLGWKLDLF